MEMLYCGLEQIEGVRIYGNHDVCRGPVNEPEFSGTESFGCCVYSGKRIWGSLFRSGLHCSPLIHKAMGTEEGGTVRVSVSWFTEEKDIKECFISQSRTKLRIC